MNITIIHGQVRKGNTYHMTKLLSDQLKVADNVIHEFFLPVDGPTFCTGCHGCFYHGEQACPHHAQMTKLLNAIKCSQIIILNSPCYELSMSGQMKTMLDHLAFQWMTHRPHETMFQKVGICVATSAGAGAKKVTKQLKQHMNYWGISNVYQLSNNLHASCWEEVSDKKKESLKQKACSILKKADDNIKKPRVSIKIKLMFLVFRRMQMTNTWLPHDHIHWEQQGWLAKKRPWKN